MKENYRPWNVNIDDFPKEKSLSEQIRFVLQYAILAPSTHNTQPWLFKIKESECDIFYNPNLILPEADAKMRDLYISMGCCVENLMLASNYFNIFDSIIYGPFENKEQVAMVRFKKYAGSNNSQYKEVVDTITKRINARGIFYKDPVPSDLLNKVSLTVNNYLLDGIELHWVSDKSNIMKLASLTAEGLKIAYIKSSFRKEMSQWMNNSLTKKKQGIPGYALKMPLFLSFVIPTLVRWFNIGNFLSKKNYSSISSAPLLVVITAQKENPNSWMKIGQLAERLFLEFNGSGWQTSIFVAAIEMGNLYKEVQKIIGTDQLPQFLFTVGKIDLLHKQTPRHNLERKIVS